MSKKSILITPLHFTVSAIIQIHLLVVLKFYMSHLLSNYKYFSKMYILVRVIALLFHCAPSVWRARSKWSLWSLAENQQNGNISNVYRWRIYLWNVSYALGKTARLKHIKQHLCQRHTQPFCQSIWQGECEPLYTETLNYRLLYLTSFFFKALNKACHMFRTNCIMHFLRRSSVCVLPRYFFQMRSIKLLYININSIASYIAYKEYIDMLYKLDIPPSPSLN